ncbi:RNA methyltransferase [Streptomonospora sediminis]
MDVIEVPDPGDTRLADYFRLRDANLRKSIEAEHGLFMAEGDKVIRRALTAGYTPRSLLLTRRRLETLSGLAAAVDAPVYVVDDTVAEDLTGFDVHRGALASFHRRPLRGVAEVLHGARRIAIPEDVPDHTNVGLCKTADSASGRPRVALLENLVDHANVGSAFRNAAALGIDAVLVTPECADPLYRRAIKTSMGNVFNVPWTRIGKMPETLDLLGAHGYTTVALTLSKDAITLDDLAQRDLPAIAMVFGTEAAGVDPRTAGQADLRVRIPMEAGVDSLNVAAATAVTFYATR